MQVIMHQNCTLVLSYCNNIKAIIPKRWYYYILGDNVNVILYELRPLFKC